MNEMINLHTSKLQIKQKACRKRLYHLAFELNLKIYVSELKM